MIEEYGSAKLKWLNPLAELHSIQSRDQQAHMARGLDSLEARTRFDLVRATARDQRRVDIYAKVREQPVTTTTLFVDEGEKMKSISFCQGPNPTFVTTKQVNLVCGTDYASYCTTAGFGATRQDPDSRSGVDTVAGVVHVHCRNTNAPNVVRELFADYVAEDREVTVSWGGAMVSRSGPDSTAMAGALMEAAGEAGASLHFNSGNQFGNRTGAPFDAGKMRPHVVKILDSGEVFHADDLYPTVAGRPAQAG